MSALFRLSGAVRSASEVAAWFGASGAGQRRFIEPWFDRIRACGADVVELLHDGHPTACIQDAAFACVDTFAAHSNIGFFHGTELPDCSRGRANPCVMSSCAEVGRRMTLRCRH